MLAVLNGRLRSTPYENPQNQHQQTKPPPPNAMQRESSTGTTSFLHRRLLRRRRTRKNLPKVANAPPPLSRKMMTDRQNDDEGIEEYGRMSTPSSFRLHLFFCVNLSLLSHAISISFLFIIGGAIIGELEILNNDNWQFDVIASRHSELARIPYSVINAIMMICPQAPLHLAKVVASQVRRKNNRKNKSRAGLPPSVPAPPTPAPHATDSPQKPLPSGKVTTQNILPSYDLSVATIAVVPLLEGDFDLAGFCNMLRTTLNDKIAPTKLMTKEIAKEKLGELWNNRNAMHALKMTRL